MLKLFPCLGRFDGSIFLRIFTNLINSYNIVRRNDNYDTRFSKYAIGV